MMHVGGRKIVQLASKIRFVLGKIISAKKYVHQEIIRLASYQEIVYGIVFIYNVLTNAQYFLKINVDKKRINVNGRHRLAKIRANIEIKYNVYRILNVNGLGYLNNVKTSAPLNP